MRNQLLILLVVFICTVVTHGDEVDTNDLIAKSDFRMLGIVIRFPDEPEKNDLVVFDESFEFDGISVPRIRHWYSESSRDYNGSDLMLKEMTEDN